MNIRLHIEQLVLDGLPVTRGQSAQVKAAVEAELGRLLSERGVSRELASGGALPGVDAPALRTSRGTSPTQLGTQIARSVYAGVGKP
jgi:hypothetical protein